VEPKNKFITVFSHKIPPLVHIFSQINPAQSLPLFCLALCFTTLFQKLDYIASIGWQVNEDDEKTRTNIHALKGIQSHGLSVQAIMPQTPRGHWYRISHSVVLKSVLIVSSHLRVADLMILVTSKRWVSRPGIKSPESLKKVLSLNERAGGGSSSSSCSNGGSSRPR
jgi:hypothetical protein